MQISVRMVASYWAQSCFMIVALTHMAFEQVTANFGLTSKHPVYGADTEAMASHMSASLQNGGPFSKQPYKMEICNLLKLRPRQKRMCKRNPGIAKTLLEAVTLSSQECQYQFKYERWNCTMGTNRINLLRKGKGFRETSVLHALSSSSLVHSFARACSQNQLRDRCTCDESAKHRDAWKWGGCGDNIRFGARFTRRFLRARANHRDIQAEVDYHNIQVGIKTVRQGMRAICKCHGISGSCTTKTCWRRLAQFSEIGETLKNKYNRAMKVIVTDNDSRHENRQSYLQDKDTLLFTEKSPNFCEKNQFSPGISGRICRNASTCDAMCCGEGYNTQVVTARRSCNCTWAWCCEVKCNSCQVVSDRFVCK